MVEIFRKLLDKLHTFIIYRMNLDVEEVFPHPNYADTLNTPVGHLLADVALLKLKKKVGTKKQ